MNVRKSKKQSSNTRSEMKRNVFKERISSILIGYDLGKKYRNLQKKMMNE